MEYKLLAHVDTKKLSEEVTKHLKEGWELHGHTRATTESRYQPNYFQAVVRGYYDSESE
jgi:hypothetical protein